MDEGNAGGGGGKLATTMDDRHRQRLGGKCWRRQWLRRWQWQAAAMVTVILRATRDANADLP
eukprot:1508175-Lingulodinium_polyedra.AAC.1